MGTDDVGGFGHGCALSMALPISGPNGAVSSGQKPAATTDHEFVIAPRGNRALQGDVVAAGAGKAPTVRRGVACPTRSHCFFGDFRMNARTAITAATLACSLAAALATAAHAGPAAAQPGPTNATASPWPARTIAPLAPARAARNVDRRLRSGALEICGQGQLRRHDDPEGPRLAHRDVGSVPRLPWGGCARRRCGLPDEVARVNLPRSPVGEGVRFLAFSHVRSGKSSILNSASARSPRSASALSRWRSSTRRILPDTVFGSS